MDTLLSMGESDVKSRDRTEYGQRLVDARTHAKLTQAQLAEKTGLSQSNIAFLEKKGHWSGQTVLLAHACGVRAVWLAKGEGPMVGPETELDAARAVASEAMPGYLKPNDARDYRTMAHTLAATLEQSGVSLPIKQFLSLVDDLYRKLGNEK